MKDDAKRGRKDILCRLREDLEGFYKEQKEGKREICCCCH